MNASSITSPTPFTIASPGGAGFAKRLVPTEGKFIHKLILATIAASMAVPIVPAFAEARGYDGKVWKDSKGRTRCTRPDGTAGLIVGGAGGALLGRAIDTRGDRATGTILGAAAGALLGRNFDRNRVRCR